MELLTHSRGQSFKTCPKQHWIAYELGVRRKVTDQPLRMGSAVHLGIEVHADTGDIYAACKAVYDNYAIPPEWADETDWAVEREICLRLLTGYFWRWSEDKAEVVANEFEFKLPIINPETGKASRTFEHAGKVDKIIRLADGRLAVREHKTTGDSIKPDGDYWRRLRIDTQISGYMLAARACGHDVETVEYDVIHKPGMRPKKIVKKDFVEWIATGEYYGETIERDEGAVVETPAMYGARLTGDITENPDKYYARREIPRLDADLDEFRTELWQIAKDILDAKNKGFWYRNTSACLHPFKCPYFGICTEGLDPLEAAGFVQNDNVHPELGGKNGNGTNSTAVSFTASTAEVAVTEIAVIHGPV